MAPTLIDTRGWIKFGFIALLFAAIIFSSGFLLGYQDARTYYQANSEPFSLSLPKKTVAPDDSIEPVIPNVISAGEEIDVDKAGTITILSTADVTATGNSSKLQELQVEKSNFITELNSPRLAMDKGHNLEIPNGVDFTPENADKIKYSIQVGMYGRLSNAEKMAARLITENFDAYVSEYINDQNEIRYNVRLGYFVDKKSARATLKHFRSKQSSEAYVVNFSIETMVFVAEVEEETTETKLSSDSLSISSEIYSANQEPNKGINHENISQAVVFPVSKTRQN